MQLFINIVLIIIGFIILIKGANWLVESASSLARSFGMSPMIVGLSVIAFWYKCTGSIYWYYFRFKSC
jgi:cation:H+ antiporter